MTGTNYQKLIGVISPELDELYITIRNIETASHIFTARGVSLDNIGVLIDFERRIGESDDVYRERLINIISTNITTGTKGAIKKLLVNFLRIDESNILIHETVPNYIFIQLPPECETQDAQIKELMYRAVASGVYVGFFYSGKYWDVAEWDNITPNMESEWS